MLAASSFVRISTKTVRSGSFAVWRGSLTAPLHQEYFSDRCGMLQVRMCLRERAFSLTARAAETAAKNMKSETEQPRVQENYKGICESNPIFLSHRRVFKQACTWASRRQGSRV